MLSTPHAAAFIQTAHPPQMLIENDANVAAQDCNGRHAMHYVAQRLHPSTLKAVAIAQRVLDATHNQVLQPLSHDTAAIITSQHRISALSTPALQALNVRDKRGTTPFMLACQKVRLTTLSLACGCWFRLLAAVCGCKCV